MNGINVLTPEDLMHEVSQSKNTLQFRIAPSHETENTFKSQQVLNLILQILQCYLKDLNL